MTRTISAHWLTKEAEAVSKCKFRLWCVLNPVIPTQTRPGWFGCYHCRCADPSVKLHMQEVIYENESLLWEEYEYCLVLSMMHLCPNYCFSWHIILHCLTAVNCYCLEARNLVVSLHIFTFIFTLLLALLIKIHISSHAKEGCYVVSWAQAMDYRARAQMLGCSLLACLFLFSRFPSGKSFTQTLIENPGYNNRPKDARLFPFTWARERSNMAIDTSTAKYS